MIAFIGGALPADARAAVEEHVAACSACAELITWAAADQAGNGATGSPGQDGRPFVGDLHPGARVDRYQILGALGRGGMGEVYAAYHPDLDRRIALKVVRRLGGGSAEHHARLLREARAIARLSHPNVVTVHDAGTFGDRVFIAMELIDGQTIDQWLHAAPRGWREILEVFIAAGRGLAAAHAAGVVHRDFKPQNVMIAKNGGVRVMDFGLARVGAGDPGDAGDGDAGAGADSPPLPILSVTKTGAIIGTPAYMSPEQFRREATDARSDQFSFCVALHEALYGTRPTAAVGDTGEPTPQAAQPLPRGGVPSWLRAVVRRGASVDREARYPSMEAVIAALERGRARLRRRVSIAAAVVATVLLGGAAWRLGQAHQFTCSLPRDRVAAAWTPGAATDARRQSIHRAFLASGRPAAETSWQRVSRVLDDYMKAWSAMYLQACEATNVRGEQSAEVLDLRMSCLGDNLDQVRALTDTLVTADSDAVSHAVAAALEITPVARCANVPLLKSAVPLPRDERTLREVEALRRALTEVETLREFGRLDVALARAVALRPRVEATGFRPLLGELLAEIGLVQSDMFDLQAVKTLEEAMFVAEASHDDITRARAATSLIYLAGIQRNSAREAERWFRLTIAIHDRLGPGHERTRGWALQNYGAVLEEQGDFEASIARTREAIALKEQSVGRDHPDVAISLENLSQALCGADRPEEALAATNRALTILETNSDPGSPMLANALIHKAEALVMLGHRDEARQLLARARDVVRGIDAQHPFLASAAEDLGRIELDDGHPTTAIPLLEDAQRVYEKYPGAEALLASTRYALARAFWQRPADRPRALPLAESARELYAHSNRAQRAQEVAEWIAGHRGARR